MNARKAKQIRKRALHLLVEWLQSQVPESEVDKINIKNIKNIIPSDTHIYANHKILLSAYSFKWIINNNINSLQLKDIENYHHKYNKIRRIL